MKFIRHLLALALLWSGLAAAQTTPVNCTANLAVVPSLCAAFNTVNNNFAAISGGSASAIYPSVALVAASNLTLSGAQTVDGQLGTAGQTLVLATAQSTASQNGPWIMQSGAWTRPAWYPSGGTTQAVQFATTFIRLGTTYQGSVWRLTTAAPITIDTTATTWAATPLALNSQTVGGTGLPLANIAPQATGTILGAPSVMIAGVSITGTAGQFAFTGSGLAIGQFVTLTGTYGGTGSITGYTNPTTYYVSATNGTSTFTLQTTAKAAIATTAGTPTGLTYSSTAAPQAEYLYVVAPAETTAGITVSQLNTAYPFLDARRYKIDLTGATDSTTAMTLAHSMGLIINYPSGVVKFSTLSMPWGGIQGAGSSDTIFYSTDQTTANLITVTCTGYPPNSKKFYTATGMNFSGFSITTSYGGSSYTKTAGYVIYASSSDAFAGNASRFTDIVFYNMASGVYLNNITAPSFVSDVFGLASASTGTGISFGTPGAVDSGGMMIVNTYIGAGSGGYGVHHLPGGGVHITGSTIDGGLYSYYVDISGSVSTSDLYMVGNSFEGFKSAGIYFFAEGGNTSNFSNITITGNEFEIVDNGATAMYAIEAASSPVGTFGNITIGNNVIADYDVHGGAAIYLDYVKIGLVVNNSITATNGVGLNFGTNNSVLSYGNNAIFNNNSTTYVTPGNATAINAAPGTFYPYGVANTRSITAAENEALAAGGGTVQLPPISITLTGTLPLLTGVKVNGSGWTVPGTGGAPNGGTVLVGDGTFPAFYYVGAAGGSTAQATLGDLASPLGSSSIFTGDLLVGAGVSNMAFNNFSYAIKAGALYNPGLYYGTQLKNLYAYGCTQWAFWFENFQEWDTATGLQSHFSKNGQAYVASGTTLINMGNITVSHLFNQGSTGNNGNGGGRGLYFAARGNSSSLNDMVVLDAQNNGAYLNSTQSSTPTASNSNLPVTDLSQFGIGMPVTFGSTANGFTTNFIYFVVGVSGTSGAGTIQVATSIGGTAINSTGTTTFNIITDGYAGFEVSASNAYTSDSVTFSFFDNLDLEGGGTSPVVIQNMVGSNLDIGIGSAASGTPASPTFMTWINSKQNTIFNRTAALTIYHDSSVTNLNSFFGMGFLDQFSAYLGIGLFANSGTTSAVLSLSGTTTNSSNSPYDLAYSTNAAQLIQGMAIALPFEQKAATANADRGGTVIAFTGSTGQTLTLPDPTQYTVGNPFIISNPTVNPVSVVTTGSLNFVGQGLTTASLTLPAKSTASVIGSRNSGTFYYALIDGGVAVAPTISSGFGGTTPSIASHRGPQSFSVNVGSGTMTSAGVIGLPTAQAGWACSAADVTTPASNLTQQTGSTTASATFTNYVRTTGVAGNWPASDILEIQCSPN